MMDDEFDFGDDDRQAQAQAVAQVIQHPSAARVPDEPIVQAEVVGLAEILPKDFPLLTLLRFLPDVRLKQQMDSLAAEALAIDVKAPGGLEAADAILPRLKAQERTITECFDDPVSLANQLHKRLTGLRAEFLKGGQAAILQVGSSIRIETQRRKDEAAKAAAEAQRKADEQARDQAAAAAKRAEQSGAPQQVVEALERKAETATAPPVQHAYAPPPLANTSVAENWKARLRGTTGDMEPNPDMADLTVDQQESVRRLMSQVVQGLAPLTCFDINWSALNKRAKSEKTTLDLAGVEAFDEGSTRQRRGRR